MARRGRRRKGRPVDGVVLLDKPTGLTSNAALQKVRRLYHAAKAGHTGSLDPLASGMLPLCFGEATKISAFLLDADKTYRVAAKFGVRTDTGDADGRIIEESADSEPDPDELARALVRFTGKIEQVPPMYSALKHKGRRLYDLAREGIDVPRDPRPVTVHEFRWVQDEHGLPVFEVTCSKGTYIRTLIEDVAKDLGMIAHAAALRRLWVHPFEDQEVIGMDILEEKAAVGFEALDSLLLPIDVGLTDMPPIELSASDARYMRQGQPVRCAEQPVEGLVRLYDEGDSFFGVGEFLEDGRVAPRRLFATDSRRP